MKHNASNTVSVFGSINVLVLAFVLTCAPAAPLSGATTVQLGITLPNSVNEFTRSAFLTWNAEAGCVYKIQGRATLNAATPWVTEEPVLATTAMMQWSSPERLSREKYYRLLLPQPEILSVEPAVVDPNSPGTDIYILGQCLPTNALVQIGELFFTPTLINSNGVWASVRLNGLPPGTPVQGITIVDAGTSNVIATLPHALQTSPGVSQQLVEPPVEPPASPVTASLGNRKKYKNNEHIEPDPKLDWANEAMGLQRLGGNILIHGDSSEVVFDIQEGKKGLNAVNVKLARMAGGGELAAARKENTDLRGTLGSGRSGTGRRWNEPFDRHYVATADEDGYRALGPELLPFSGEVEACDVDLAIPGRGLDFVWARTYRSRTGTNTAMGQRWSHAYNVFVEQDPSGIAVNDGTGRRDIYFPGTNGVYSRDEFFNAGALSKNTFTLTFPDTGRWEFNPFGVSPAAGKLARMVDRNGNYMTFAYDSSGWLTEIVDTLGRTNTVACDTAGRVTSLTDFSGRRVTYAYYAGETGGSPGDLKSVTTPAVTGTPNGNDFPDGKTTTYTYSTGFADERENHLLLSVTAPKGQTSRTLVYQHNQTDLDFLRCVSAQNGTNTPSCYRWALVSRPAGSYATLECFANDPVGNVTESFFDSRNRCVLVREFTGRATPGLPVTDKLNRPTGKLRAEDPDFYETLWTWNNDSLCTRVTYPGGNATTCIYEREFDKNASPRKKGDLRILRELASGSGADTDGDGVPDTTQLTTTFQYDPGFGSPATSRGKKLYVGNLPFSASDQWQKVDNSNMRVRVNDLEAILKNLGLLTRNGGINETLPYATLHSRKGWDGTIKGLIVDEDRDAFVVSTTDPRGNVTTASYDAAGNVTECRYPKVGIGTDAPTSSFAYNAYGQLTDITNAADGAGHRRVDTCRYYSSGPQAGFLQSCTEDAAGLAITSSYEYDARANVTRCVDARGFDTLFTYNALDQVMTVARQTQQSSFGERTTTTFTYDDNDNVVRWDTENRDQNNLLDPVNPAWTTLYEYDVLDRCTAVMSEIAEMHYATNRLFYDGNGSLTEAHSPLAALGIDSHNIQAFQYDERGLLFQAIAAPGTGLGSTNEWSYTPNGKIRRVKAELYVETCAYDGFDRRVSITDAMGNGASCAYDRNGHLVYARCDGEINDVAGSTGNRRLAETRYQYDALDRPVRRIDSFFDIFTEISISDGAATTSFTYAPNGQLLSTTDDNGHTTTCAYDTAGRFASATDARGNMRMGTRDALGNLTALTSIEHSDLGGTEQLFTSTYQYDPLNRLIARADNVGNTSRYFYDSRGNVVRETDPRGMVTGHTYDGLSREILLEADTDGDGEFTSPGDIITSRTWDDNSRLLSRADGNGNTTRYAYDALDRCVGITNADGTTHQLTWSPRSNLLGEQDANGTVISNSFDLLDRCVRRDITPAAGVAATTTFETFIYDGLSRCVMASNDVSQIDFSYDSLGNSTGGQQDGFPHAATHDGVGNCLSLTYPSGRVVTYSYDSLNRVTNVATTGGGVSHPQLARFAYDGPGRLARIGRDNGVSTRLDWNGLMNPPNSAGDFGWQQVSRVRHGTVGAPSSVSDISSTFSPSQSKLTKADAGRALDTTLAYDALDRLAESSVSSKGLSLHATRYTLDANGNRQQVIADGAAMPYLMDNTLPEPADFQMDQYTFTPFAGEQHDRNGNLVVTASLDVTNYYTYDYADRLVSVERIAAESSTVSFTYDALGRRIAKVSEARPMAPRETKFLYGGDDCDGVMEERVAGAPITIFVHVSGLTEEIRQNDNVVFARKPFVIITETGETLFTHEDDLGNVLALTDASGAVLERYDYDDYGQPQFLTSDGLPITGSDGLPVTSSPAGNSFLFHGMEWDAETGLYFSGTKRFGIGDTAPECPLGKYLDPKTGRYTTKLAHGIATGANNSNNRSSAYTFAGNNPWTGGTPNAMKTGTVKFFNESKGFGLVAGGGGGDKPTAAQFGTLIDSTVNKITDRYLVGLRSSGQFNPREYTVNKSSVWLKKEEGGRHTPFHNKYRSKE